MTESNATPEEQIARVTVSADTGFLPPVIHFVRQMSDRLGLSDEAAEHMDGAIDLVCRNIIQHAFGPGEEGSYDVHVLRGPGRVVVAVEDQGLPFDYSRLQEGKDQSLLEILHRSFDEIRFINLGRHGNRVELIKHLPHADVRDHLPEEEHRRTVEAAEEVVPLEIRMMRPEESYELSRCF